jgi:hypothetical protein
MTREPFQISLGGPPPKCRDCGKDWPKFDTWTAAHWSATLTHNCGCGAVYDFRNGKAKQVKRGRTWAKKASS